MMETRGSFDDMQWFPVYLKLTCKCIQWSTTYHETTNNMDKNYDLLQISIVPVYQDRCIPPTKWWDMLAAYGPTENYVATNDKPPPITQQTQDYGYFDFSGFEVACRSVHERRSPERLSLSGRIPLPWARRKGKKKYTSTLRNFNEEDDE
uniref:Uncharacterized protein n=1 Tax=Oryza nivara TaxID=4536 RepID=A0A0E0J9T0_ORYNI